MLESNHWSTMPVVARRFWTIACTAILLGPFLAWQSDETFDVLSVAAGSLAIVVVLTWFAEASSVEGWPVRIATLAAAAAFSLALLPWSAGLAGWLVVLVFAAIAVEDRKPDLANVGDAVEPQPTPAAASSTLLDETPESDDDIISSQVRRITDGYECVEGVVVSAAAGPTHVVFHPPLKTTPEIEIHAIDDCDARIAESTPYGFRVNTDGPGRIAFSAASPAA